VFSVLLDPILLGMPGKCIQPRIVANVFLFSVYKRFLFMSLSYVF